MDREVPPGRYAGRNDWPLISIVMPSFNQNAFIEHGIRSVLLQNYPALEFFVLDGGSTDGAAELIRKYAEFLTYSHSRRDRGQSDAINQGLRMTKGTLWAYLNSDDYYEPGTFAQVAECYLESKCDWITGNGEYVRPDGSSVEVLQASEFPALSTVLLRFENPRSGAIQVSNFMTRRILDRYGLFDESLHYCMDMDFGLRLLADGIYPKILPGILAKARLHESSKTVSNGHNGKFLREDVLVARRFLPRLPEGEQRMVQKKLDGLEMFLNLQDVELSSSPWRLLARYALEHPRYLVGRPFWGAARKLTRHRGM